MRSPTMSHARHATALHFRSPAKINLLLEVLHRRPDGYHEIRSVAQGVGLYDELSFTPADQGDVRLTCDAPDLPCDARNLILQAAQALADYAEVPDHCRIHLTKRIPVASGLGGGSSNAAATLAALNRLWNLDLDEAVLQRLAARLGSDVPLFFSLPTASLRGRGEWVQPLTLAWSGWVLLVWAGVAVPTGPVYQAWSPADRRGEERESVVAAIAQARSATELGTLLRNDLEPAVFRVAPRVGALFESLRVCGLQHVRISGAGQTAFVLFDDKQEAESVRDRLVASGIGTGARVAETLAAPWTF